MDHKDVFTAIIAAYVASISTFQWITARNKLRLDLYNRRFEIYIHTLDFVQTLADWEDRIPEERQEKRRAFVRACRESRFLFERNSGIMSLLEELNERSFNIVRFFDVAHSGRTDPDILRDLLKSRLESRAWAMNCILPLEELLAPYLGFGYKRSLFDLPKLHKP